jgi:acyl phosphate:glycerol-3-phosphate acyltransferase
LKLWLQAKQFIVTLLNMENVIAIILGYISGSIPYGLLLSKLAGLGDVRSIGSGNIGATNVLRTGNKSIAALTLLCDALKGTLPVLLAYQMWGINPALLASFSAMAGHIFPIWLKFKGGKGVATLIGVVFGLHWPLGLTFLAVWLLTAIAFKFSSLAALTASLLLPLCAATFGRSDLILPLGCLTLIVWITHRANIQRLLNKTESKINLSSKK